MPRSGKRSPLLFAIVGGVCPFVYIYWMSAVGREVNAAHDRKRINPWLPWMALASGAIGFLAAGHRATEVDPPSLNVPVLAGLAAAVLLVVYGVNLASAVRDLKVGRGLDAGAAARRMQAQIVLLTFIPPVGMYLVQKDLNGRWQVGEETPEVPATS